LAMSEGKTVIMVTHRISATGNTKGFIPCKRSGMTGNTISIRRPL
jgi:hypothetical protein